MSYADGKIPERKHFSATVIAGGESKGRGGNISPSKTSSNLVSASKSRRKGKARRMGY